LIATGQYVWLRLKGTNADGSDYDLEIHTAPGSMVSDKWLEQGYYERSIAFAGLRNLKDGSTLRMEFKAAFGKSTNESEAVVFPVRTYTIKAFEDVRPDITRAINSKGEEILPGGYTVDLSITLKGKGAKGQKVLIKDDNIEIGIADVDPQSGDWEFTVSNLSEASHPFTATAQYGSGQVSNPWVVVVTANVAPTITRAEDSKGVEIPPNGMTVDTSITLKGKGAKGQKVLIKDGAIEIGIADVDPLSGDWELRVTGLTVASHSFTATALYGGGEVSNPPRIVVVADFVDFVEDFSSYPLGVILRYPGESMEGTNTKVTVNANIAPDINGTVVHRYVADTIHGLRANTGNQNTPSMIAYSLALKQGRAKSAMFNGRYAGLDHNRLKVEFLLNTVVVGSIVLFEGSNDGPSYPINREIAPPNGQAFDTLKFELTALPGYFLMFRIQTITFKS